MVTSTQPVTDESLLHIIRSLKKISQEAVMSSVILTLLKEKPDWTEFGASKMLETSKTNIHRISIFWDIVRDHFMELSQNKVFF